jgi:hypothetical protein
MELFGSNRLILNLVGKLAFASTPWDFTLKMQQVLHDLVMFQAAGILNQEIFAKFCREFGIVVTADRQLVFQGNATWPFQAIWNRTTAGGVHTTTAHSEKIHQRANHRCGQIRNVWRRIRILILTIYERFEAANKFKHAQADKKLKELTILQTAARLQPQQECTDPRCGWGRIFASRYGLAWFPCKHTVNSRVVQFPTKASVNPRPWPAFPPPLYGPVQRNNVQGLPSLVPRPAIRSKYENMYALSSNDPNLTFIEELCSDVRFISMTKDPYMLTFINISIDFGRSNASQNPDSLSQFRLKWLMAATQ